MGHNVNGILIMVAMVLAFIVAAGWTIESIEALSNSIISVEHFIATTHTNVKGDKQADVDMRNVPNTVSGSTVIQSIRHIQELGVRVRVDGTLYVPESDPFTPPDPVSDPGMFPTMPDEHAGTFSIDANAEYVPSYIYNSDGSLYEVRFTRK